MNYANILTGETRLSLPTTYVTTDEQWSEAGWRKVVETEQPAKGFEVSAWEVSEVDKLTCRLKIKAQQSAADITAARELAEKESVQAFYDTTNESAIIVRALAELLLTEINTLRKAAGLSEYTKTQFVSALKTKIAALT